MAERQSPVDIPPVAPIHRHGLELRNSRPVQPMGDRTFE
jgi:hypothetical protein